MAGGLGLPLHLDYLGLILGDLNILSMDHNLKNHPSIFRCCVAIPNDSAHGDGPKPLIIYNHAIFSWDEHPFTSINSIRIFPEFRRGFHGIPWDSISFDPYLKQLWRTLVHDLLTYAWRLQRFNPFQASLGTWKDVVRALVQLLVGAKAWLKMGRGAVSLSTSGRETLSRNMENHDEQ